jgi:hypothetical protein
VVRMRVHTLSSAVVVHVLRREPSAEKHVEQLFRRYVSYESGRNKIESL